MSKLVPIILGIVVFVALLISASVIFKFPKTLYKEELLEATQESINQSDDENIVTKDQNKVVEEKSDKDKLCSWVDDSDIIIKVNFAEGVSKDTSYEAGFAFSNINRTAKLARSGCDYRTGFNFEEMKGKGVVEVAVWGYSDSRKRTILNAPVNVTFDAEGKPDIGTSIEVTILD